MDIVCCFLVLHVVMLNSGCRGKFKSPYKIIDRGSRSSILVWAAWQFSLGCNLPWAPDAGVHVSESRSISDATVSKAIVLTLASLLFLLPSLPWRDSVAAIWVAPRFLKIKTEPWSNNPAQFYPNCVIATETLRISTWQKKMMTYGFQASITF